MPISVACTSCGTKLKANENLVGRTLKCPQCKASVVVIQELPPSRPQVNQDRESDKPSPKFVEVPHTPAFICSNCGDRYPVQRGMEGKSVRCRSCDVPGTAIILPGLVRKIRREPVASIDHPTGPSEASAAVGKPSVLPGMMLLLLGIALIVAAWMANASVDEQEMRQMRIDEAKGRVSILLGQWAGTSPTMPSPTPNSDRLHVYFLAGFGALAIGFGFVCLTIAKTAAKSRKGGVP